MTATLDDTTLRPSALSDFGGQPRVSAQLNLVLAAARSRDTPAPHILLAGPPGLGKTTIALIIGSEMKVSTLLASGPALQSSADLAVVMGGIQHGDVLFIDEIHRMNRAAMESLYLAMEDFRIDVTGRRARTIYLPPFTLVGATTHTGLLPGALLDRFGFTAHLEFYSVEALTDILRRSAVKLNFWLDDDAATEIARRSRGVPRVALRLMGRARDWAAINGPGRYVSLSTAHKALDLFEVDELGLDRLDRAILTAICTTFDGGPVGLTTLAGAVDEQVETVADVSEPFLVRSGLLARTRSGRIALPAAYAHLGIRH